MLEDEEKGPLTFLVVKHSGGGGPHRDGIARFWIAPIFTPRLDVTNHELRLDLAEIPRHGVTPETRPWSSLVPISKEIGG